MTRFIAVLMSCSLALAATVVAQQDQEQQENGNKKQGRKEAHEQQTNQQSGQGRHKQKTAGEQNAATPQNGAASNTPGNPQMGGAGTGKGKRRDNADMNGASPNASPNVNANEDANVNGGGKQAGQGKRGGNRGKDAATTSATSAGATTQTPAGQNAATGAQTNNVGGRGRKLDSQKIQAIKSQHVSFRAQPRPDIAPAVTFNQSYRIQGAERWQGPQYEVFRSYHPERHDQVWYRSHYNRVELIGGGYYYWNNGYWYPAWGYSPAQEYYAWDGPIYVGQRAEPPDRVIADVQAVLQDEGYYRGDVDGLLGPLTREALTAYQADHGLYTTAAIDEPTLDSLGMG